MSPCVLTELSEQPAFKTSSAMSTLPAYAAQWRHTLSSCRRHNADIRSSPRLEPTGKVGHKLIRLIYEAQLIHNTLALNYMNSLHD